MDYEENPRAAWILGVLAVGGLGFWLYKRRSSGSMATIAATAPITSRRGTEAHIASNLQEVEEREVEAAQLRSYRSECEYEQREAIALLENRRVQLSCVSGNEPDCLEIDNIDYDLWAICHQGGD